MKGTDTERSGENWSLERAEALFDHLGSIARATVMVSTVWALVLREHRSPWVVGSWWLLNITVAAGRLELRRRYQRAKSESRWTNSQARQWICRYSLGAALSGCMWGVTVLLLWVPGSLEHQVIMALIFCGLTAGAASTLAVHRMAFYAWLLPALLPLMVRCAFEGGLYLVLGAVFSAFTATILLSARRSSGVHRDSFRLHAENRELIERLRSEEQALRESNQALELRVDERTQALRVAQQEKEQAELDLMHAQKLEALGQLTGGIAHDFNNLLTVVVGSLEAIDATGELSPRTTKLTQNAMRAAERGARLTHSLLAFSRRQLLQPSTIDLRKMLRELSDSLLNSALGARIELAFELPRDLWTVRADPDRLQTALLNLCVNARDAMVKGGKITLRASNLKVDGSSQAVMHGDYVQLEVQDQGCGIPQGQVDHVFEPFFSTKQDGAGSGLGLSMVYGFCQQSGGHVRLDSSVGVGTTVTLLLPRSFDAHAAESKKQVALTELPNGKSQTVLVVEDEPEVRELAAEMLTLLHYEVNVAPDAVTALQLLSDPQFPVSFLFSDITMPGKLDGFDLARQAQLLRPHLAIVLTSGFHGNAAGASALSHWIQLPKPYGIQELAHALAKAGSRQPNGFQERVI